MNGFPMATFLILLSVFNIIVLIDLIKARRQLKEVKENMKPRRG